MCSDFTIPGMRAGSTVLQRILALLGAAGVAAPVLLGAAPPADAAVLTFTDKTEWLSHLSSSTDFSLDASNVLLADEVSSPPAANELLGTSLTFAAGNTGLPFGFTFAADPPETPVPGVNVVIYIENPIGNGLGVSTSFGEHDWVVSFADPVFALGMTIRGAGSFDDGFAYLDSSGGTLAGFPHPPNPSFLGIISETPISQFLYEDSVTSGGRTLIELSTGALTSVPEPGTLAIVGLALVGLCLVRRRTCVTAP